MKSKSVVIAVIALAVAGLVLYSRMVPGHAPAGQRPLANLDDASFEREFRAAAPGTRVLVMLSPT